MKPIKMDKIEQFEMVYQSYLDQEQDIKTIIYSEEWQVFL